MPTVKAAAALYAFTNFVGLPGGWGNADGPIWRARFTRPTSVAVDRAGNLVVADYWNAALRKVSSAGEVSTLLWVPSPIGLTQDGAGNLYFVSGNQIESLSPQGTLRVLAGSYDSGVADGMGPAARFNSPEGLALDARTNLYVADTGNHTIRRISTAGVVSTLAGSAGQPGALDGAGSAARFNRPRAVAVEAMGNVLVADSANAAIRKITPAGEVTTLAGGLGQFGHVDGAGTVARFTYPSGLVIDAAGTLYVADSGQTIRKITPTGVVSTLAGDPYRQGSLDGIGSAALFKYPLGLALDGGTNLYVADSENSTVRRITPGGAVTTVAGQPSMSGDVDGLGTAARFENGPEDVALDSGGNLYAVDSNAHKVRKVTPAGLSTTLAGRGMFGSGAADGMGTNAQFYGPSGLAVDRSGVIYVADRGNHTLRRIAQDGTVTTLAGSPGVPGTNDGPVSVARFRYPTRLAVDEAGNLFVTDWGSHTIRKVSPAGEVTTLAGSPGMAGSADGVGTAARFNEPWGLALDSLGNLYVADYRNHAIRKITPGGIVTTLAGQLGFAGSADGVGTAAQFNGPLGLAVDTFGNLYVADAWNRTIRFVTAAGIVTTLGGSSQVAGGCDGVGTNALFSFPIGLAISSNGTLYVADSSNSRIARGAPLLPPLIISQPAATNATCGSAVTLAVSANGAEPLSYQWYRGEDLLAGATASSHTFTATRLTAGAYLAVLTNPAGSVTSTVATVTLTNLTPLQVLACAGTNVLQATANCLVALPDLRPQIVLGECSVTPVMSQTPDPGTLLGPGTYTVALLLEDPVSHFAGFCNATVIVNDAIPPVITSPPASRTNVVGTTATFDVTATACSPLNYQWRFRGTNLANATAATLTVTNVQAANAGAYDVMVTSAGGSVTSAPAVLTVPTVSTAPVRLTQTVSGGLLTLSWPADHLGWRLEMQTDALGQGLRTNWLTLTGSTLTNRVVTRVQPQSSASFFRLAFP